MHCCCHCCSCAMPVGRFGSMQVTTCLGYDQVAASHSGFCPGPLPYFPHSASPPHTPRATSGVQAPASSASPSRPQPPTPSSPTRSPQQGRSSWRGRCHCRSRRCALCHILMKNQCGPKALPVLREQGKGSWVIWGKEAHRSCLFATKQCAAAHDAGWCGGSHDWQ